MLTVKELKRYKRGTQVMLGSTVEMSDYSLQGLDDYNQRIFGQIGKISRISKWSVSIAVEDGDVINYEFDDDLEELGWLSILDENLFGIRSMKRELKPGDSVTRAVIVNGLEVLSKLYIVRIIKQDYMKSGYINVPDLCKITFIDQDGEERFWCSRCLYSYVTYNDAEFIPCKASQREQDKGKYLIYKILPDGVRFYCGTRGWLDKKPLLRDSAVAFKLEMGVLQKYNVSIGRVVDGGVEKVNSRVIAG